MCSTMFFYVFPNVLKLRGYPISASEQNLPSAAPVGYQPQPAPPALSS